MNDQERIRQASELISSELAWVAIRNLGDPRHTPLPFGKSAIRLGVPTPSTEIAELVAQKLYIFMHSFAMLKKCGMQIMDQSESQMHDILRQAGIGEPDLAMINAMHISITKDRSMPIGSLLEITLDFTYLPGWEEANSMEAQAKLINTMLVSAALKFWNRLKETCSPKIVREVEAARRSALPETEKPSFNEDIAQAWQQSHDLLEPLRMNSGPVQPLTITFPAKDYKNGRAAACVMLYAASDKPTDNERMGEAIAKCEPNRKIVTYNFKTRQCSVKIDPTPFGEWNKAVDIMQERIADMGSSIKQTLVFAKDLVRDLQVQPNGDRASTALSALDIKRAQLAMKHAHNRQTESFEGRPADDLPSDGMAAHKAKPPINEQERERALLDKHERRQLKAQQTEQMINKAPDTADAKKAQPYDIKKLAAGLDYLEHTAPAAHRGRAGILADAVRALAAKLDDIRDEATLKLAGADELIERTALNRALGDMLLCKQNVLQAANAIELPKMFGEPAKSHVADRENETRIKKAGEYLATHPHAKALLVQWSAEIPGLMLLVQAATNTTLPDAQKAAKGWLAELGDSLAEAREYLAGMPDYYQDKVHRHLMQFSTELPAL